MTIPHLESFANKPQKALYLLEKLQKNDFVATEKMDGFNCSIQVKNGKLTLSTKSKTFVREEDFTEEIVAFAELKRYFSELSKIVFPHDFVICGEAIPNYDFNTIKYNKDKIGNGVFVIVNAEGYDEEIARSLSVASIKFMDVQVVPIQRTGLEKEIGVIESELSMHGEVLSKPARKEADKEEKSKALATIQQALVKAKHKVLDSLSLYYKPLLGNDLEGLVASFDDGTVIKLVDKEKFTEKNKANWSLLKRFEHLKNQELYSKETGTNKELIDKCKEEFEKLDKELSSSSIEGSLLKQIQIVRNHAAIKINWFSHATDVRPGAALKTVNSIVGKVQIQRLAKMAAEFVGIENYCLVGNNNKSYAGDIDIAVSEEELRRRFGSDDSFWESLEEFLKTLNVEYRIIKGLRQFHIAMEFCEGVYEPVTLNNLPKGIVQIDFLIGDLNWMKTILSSPKHSKYKAATRNVFLKALCDTKNLVGDSGSTEYSINFRDGLWLKVFDLKQPEGRQKNIQKELVHKFLMLNDPVVELQRFLFEKSEPVYEIENYTFEYWFDSFLKKYDKSIQKKALLQFEELCKKNHIDFPQEAKQALDERKTVALFPGSFKPFHKGHYEIVKKLSQEADEVVVLASISDREGFSGLQAYNWLVNSCVPFFPKNVRIEFTNKPILYAFKLAHLNAKQNKQTLLFVDEREYSSKKQTDLFELRTSERLFDVSGTKFREAISNKDIAAIKEEFLFDSKQNIQNLFENEITENIKNQYSLLVANLEALSNHDKKRQD